MFPLITLSIPSPSNLDASQFLTMGDPTRFRNPTIVQTNPLLDFLVHCDYLLCEGHKALAFCVCKVSYMIYAKKPQQCTFFSITTSISPYKVLSKVTENTPLRVFLICWRFALVSNALLLSDCIAAINDVQHLKQLHGCDTSSSLITHLARKTCRLPCRPSIYCVYLLIYADYPDACQARQRKGGVICSTTN